MSSMSIPVTYIKSDFLCNTYSSYFLWHIWSSIHPLMGIWLVFIGLTVPWTRVCEYFWVLIKFLFLVYTFKCCISCSFLFNYLKKLPYYSTIRVKGSYFFNTSPNTHSFLFLLNIFVILNLMSIHWYFIVVLIYISPVMSGVGIFSDCLEKYLLKGIVHLVSSSLLCCWVVVFLHSRK